MIKQCVMFMGNTQFCVIRVESALKRMAGDETTILGEDRDDWMPCKEAWAYQLQCLQASSKGFDAFLYSHHFCDLLGKTVGRKMSLDDTARVDKI